ncbi:MAG: hypothetical protein KDC26_09120 [Armatimonadetes bacterium]|nr:hypothetical protein [Armatimonadota bacterium]
MRIANSNLVQDFNDQLYQSPDVYWSVEDGFTTIFFIYFVITSIIDYALRRIGVQHLWIVGVLGLAVFLVLILRNLRSWEEYQEWKDKAKQAASLLDTDTVIEMCTRRHRQWKFCQEIVWQRIEAGERATKEAVWVFYGDQYSGRDLDAFELAEFEGIFGLWIKAEERYSSSLAHPVLLGLLIVSYILLFVFPAASSGLAVSVGVVLLVVWRVTMSLLHKYAFQDFDDSDFRMRIGHT